MISKKSESRLCLRVFFYAFAAFFENRVLVHFTEIALHLLPPLKIPLFHYATKTKRYATRLLMRNLEC